MTWRLSIRAMLLFWKFNSRRSGSWSTRGHTWPSNWLQSVVRSSVCSSVYSAPFVRPSVFSSGYSAVQPAVLCNQLFISQLSNQLCNRLRSVLSAAKTMGFFVIPAINSSEPWFRWLLLERKKTDLLHARAQFT